MSHQQKHDPLATVDPNRQIKQLTVNPLSDSNAKPVPAFSNESQQHQSLHSKLMKQQRFANILFQAIRTLADEDSIALDGKLAAMSLPATTL